MAKRVDSFYEAGKRSGSWVKLPCKESGTFLVGCYRPAGKSLGVVLVGLFHGRKFRFAGKVRHRLDEAARTAFSKVFRRLHTRSCPFSNLPNCKADPFDEMVTPEEMASLTWLEPRISIQVDYHEWTRMDVLRQAELAIDRLGV